MLFADFYRVATLICHGALTITSPRQANTVEDSLCAVFNIWAFADLCICHFCFQERKANFARRKEEKSGQSGIGDSGEDSSKIRNLNNSNNSSEMVADQSGLNLQVKLFLV